MALHVPACAGLGFVAAIAAPTPAFLLDGRVRVAVAPPLVVGGTGELSLTILEPPLAHGPVELWLEAEGVTLPDNRLGWDDVVDPQAEQPRLRGRMHAPNVPGTYVVFGRLRYVTCTDRYCRPREANVHWIVEVVEGPQGP